MLLVGRLQIRPTLLCITILALQNIINIVAIISILAFSNSMSITRGTYRNKYSLDYHLNAWHHRTFELPANVNVLHTLIDIKDCRKECGRLDDNKIETF